MTEDLLSTKVELTASPAVPPKKKIRSISSTIRLLLQLIPAFCCSYIALSRTQEAIMEHNLHHNITTFNEYYILSSTSTSSSSLNETTTMGQSSKSHEIPTMISNDDEKNDHHLHHHHCIHHNSKEWLLGPRLDNLNHTQQIDIYFAKRMILSTSNILSLSSIFGAMTTMQQQNNNKSNHNMLNNNWNPFQHTICYKNSSFVNVHKNNDESNNDRNIRLWVTRFVYLSIHIHQHKPALLEFMERNKKQQSNEKNDCHDYLNDHYQAGTFDYECPSAKFLVVQLFENGIGANVRLAAVPAFMAGLAMNRIVLFISNSPSGPKFIRNPWTLTSCTRYDYQCFFLPVSPCVLTYQEIENAYILQKAETRSIFRHGTLSNKNNHTNDRVLIMHLTFRPQRYPNNLRNVLHNISTQILDDFITQDNQPPPTIIGNNNHTKQIMFTTLRAAVDKLLSDQYENNNEKQNFNYYGVNSPIFHGLLMYMLRPNPQAMTSIDNIISSILPSNIFNSEHSLGLPIRGSDKCGTESECMNFNEYIDAANSIWQTYHNHNDTKGLVNNISSSNSSISIIVTTESQHVRNQYLSFLKDHHNHHPSSTLFTPYVNRFYTNDFDVTQDTGYLDSNHLHNKEYSADDAMLSAISSLKFQLSTSITIGNCCSNFHLLLKDLLQEGCGSVMTNHFHCLQNHPNSHYRLCCSWDKSEECKQRRKIMISGNENVSKSMIR